MKRTMIFGSESAAVAYARQSGLGPTQWLHGSSQRRVMGLDPNLFETVIVGSELDDEATAALREWEFRRVALNGDRGQP